MLTVYLVVFPLYFVQGFPNYAQNIPNAFNVVVDGVRAVGLGHGTLTARSASTRTANPFGLDVFNTDAISGVEFRDIWPLVCDLDSDDDGIINKDELCDPECINIGGTPECTGNFSVTHPGFVDIIDGDGGGTVDIPVNREAEIDERFYKAHGWLMIFAWVILAPLGIAMPIIFKKGQSVLWFKLHKLLMISCAVITFFSFALLLGRVRVEPINFAFKDPNSDFSKHVLLGLSVVVITFIQPISGYFRPHLSKEGKEKTLFRKFWELQHRWTGRLGLVLAFITIDYGILLIYPDAEAAGIILIVLLVLAGIFSFFYVFLGFKNSLTSSDSEVANELLTQKDIAASAAKGSVADLDDEDDEFHVTL